MSEELVHAVIIALISGTFGSGFMSLVIFLIQRNDQKKGNIGKQGKMLLGLAHDRIMYLGEHYIEQGYITSQELDDFNRYLYEPYSELGGNGTGKTIWQRVNTLPIKDNNNE